MKSSSNGGILKGHLQVLHVHVLLVALLGAGYMAEPGIDRHESRVAVWEMPTTQVRCQISSLPSPFEYLCKLCYTGTSKGVF